MCVYTISLHLSVGVCSPSAERGAVGDHMDTQGPPVTWKFHGPRQGAAKIIDTVELIHRHP